MKLRYLLLTSLATASLAGAAHAVPATGTVTINGTVADRCQFTLASATINLPELTQSNGNLDPAVVATGAADLTAWCNGTASTISVQANPLLNTTYGGGAVTGFTTRVDYTGTAATTSPAVSVSDSSIGAASASAPAALGVFTGNVHVTLGSATASGRLIAGNYQGTVVVTLTPNVSFGGG